MKVLFRNAFPEKLIFFKQKIQKMIKLITGKDDDPFGNSCVIL